MSHVIRITKGSGTGETRMAAFDAALYEAGVANYNLVRLSSIIPPGFEVRVEQCAENNINFGDRLYLVYASQIEDIVGKGAWAGVSKAVLRSRYYEAKRLFKSSRYTLQTQSRLR